MRTHAFLFAAALPMPAFAQAVAIFPDEYAAVSEGPFNSPNLPLANGTSRVLCLYEAVDLAIPSGHSITKVGFRQDATLTQLDPGRTVNLEIRMGWSTLTHTTMSTTFDTNYATGPVTVFGPANVVLPNLRDAASPLVDGKFLLTLAAPFVYAPAGRNLIVEYRCFGNSGGGSPWNYRIDRADYHSPITYGPAGCQHSGGGTPSLSVQPTRPGLNYSCSLSTGPGNSPGLLLVQPGLAMVPPFPLVPFLPGINPACTGQIDPVAAGVLSAVTSGTGAASWTFLIPNNPLFADLPISSQALFFDLFAPGNLVVSRGAEVLTGARPRTSVLAAPGLPTAVTTGSLQANYAPVAFFEHQ
jgi:hypothetical protein